MSPCQAIGPRPAPTAGQQAEVWWSCWSGGKRRSVLPPAFRASRALFFAYFLCASPAGAEGRKSAAEVEDDTQFPTAKTTGVPLGWVPKTTYTRDLRVTEVGAVIEDVRIRGANLFIDAENVTIRRVEIEGGHIINDPVNVCRNGLLLEDVSIVRASGQTTDAADQPAIGPGGYTARRTKIDGLSEGFRVGGKNEGCGPVVIEDSFARITAPDICVDWHGDGIQGYGGPALVVRNVTLELVERPGCGGTAPFFYPADQGNTSVDVDRLLVKGGGFPFRLGMPGRIRGLKIVARSWGYKSIDVDCSIVEDWEASIVSQEGSNRLAQVRPEPCSPSAMRPSSHTDSVKSKSP